MNSNSNFKGDSFDDFRQLRNRKELILYLFNIIPPEYQNRFLNNLSTLKFKKGWSYQSDMNLEDGTFITLATYSLTTNEIVSYIRGLLTILKHSRDVDYKFDYIEKRRSLAMLHELCHMGSTRFSKKENKYYTGFSVVDLNNENTTHIALTEGATDIITSRAYPTLNSDVRYYNFESAFVGQLVTILGFEFISKEYFKAEGTKGLIDKISSYGHNTEYVQKLLAIIEYLYLNFGDNNKTKTYYNGPGYLQRFFYELFKKEFINKVEDGNADKYDLLIYLNDFEEHMVTPRRLLNMGMDANKFLEISDIYIDFLNLKKELLILLSEVKGNTKIKN